MQSNHMITNKSEVCNQSQNNKITETDYKLRPVLIDKLFNCTSVIQNEFNSDTAFKFILINNNNYKYNNNSLVKIKRITISYDNIGFPYSTVNSPQTYVDGSLINFTPFNLIPVKFQNDIVYLYTELTHSIDLNKKCCNLTSNDGYIIRILHKNPLFQVSNLNIYAYGCIDDTPFTAISHFDGLVATDALGFGDYNISAPICWPNSRKSMDIILNYDTQLCLNNICPVSRYSMPTDQYPNGSFFASIDLQLNINFEIDIKKKEPACIYAHSTDCSTLINQLQDI